MAIKKSVFLEAGKFDVRFIHGFEDVYLCQRLKQTGYRMSINPESMVIRHESMGQGRFNHEAGNSILLLAKVSHLLVPDWDILFKEDGLRLRVAKNQDEYPCMSENELAGLDSRLGCDHSGRTYK